MTFNKNSIVYFNNITAAFNGLFYRPVIAHMLLTQCSQLLGVWIIIASKIAETSVTTPAYLLGMRDILGAFVLIALVDFEKRPSVKILWSTLLICSIIGTVLSGILPLYSILFVAAALISTSGFRAATCIVAVDSLAVMQKDKHSTVRMSIFMLMSPVFFALLSTSFGWLAEIDISLVFLMGSILGILCLYLTYNSPPDIESLHIAKKAKASIPDASKLMIALSTGHNLISTVIAFVIFPIYMYQKTDGDLSQFGFFFGLFGLVVIIGNQLRKVVKKQDTNLFKLMTFCVILMPICNIIWGLSYDFIPLATIAIAFKHGLSPLWNTSYFVTLKETAGEEMFRLANYKQMYYNRWAGGFSCLIGAMFFIKYEPHYPEILVGLGIINIIFNLWLIVLLKKKRLERK